MQGLRDRLGLRDQLVQLALPQLWLVLRDQLETTVQPALPALPEAAATLLFPMKAHSLHLASQALTSLGLALPLLRWATLSQ